MDWFVYDRELRHRERKRETDRERVVHELKGPLCVNTGLKKLPVKFPSIIMMFSADASY